MQEKGLGMGINWVGITPRVSLEHLPEGPSGARVRSSPNPATLGFLRDKKLRFGGLLGFYWWFYWGFIRGSAGIPPLPAPGAGPRRVPAPREKADAQKGGISK